MERQLSTHGNHSLAPQIAWNMVFGKRCQTLQNVGDHFGEISNKRRRTKSQIVEVQFQNEFKYL
jgi:hypothetical protein